MADQSQDRQLQEQKASEVAQNTASGGSKPRENRNQPGERNRKQGREKQERTVQGGGGGNLGGGGGKKTDKRG